MHWDAEIPYRDLIPDENERRWFLETVCSPAWNLEQDRGRSWEEAESLLIGEYPEHESLIRAYRERWIEMVPHTLKDNIAILEKLQSDGVDVTMLTNWNQDTWREAQTRFSFLDSTRGVTVSGQVGLIKPDAAIYHRHAESFNLTPELSLFIDDSEKNVEAARSLGWHAIHYIPGEPLQDALNNYQLKSSRS